MNGQRFTHRRIRCQPSAPTAGIFPFCFRGQTVDICCAIPADTRPLNGIHRGQTFQLTAAIADGIQPRNALHRQIIPDEIAGVLTHHGFVLCLHDLIAAYIKITDCYLSLSQTDFCQPLYKLVTTANSQTIGHSCIRLQCGNGRRRTGQTTAAAGAERSNGLAAKVHSIKEGVQNPRHIAPPDGVTHIDHRIAVRIRQFSCNGRTGALVVLLGCCSGGMVVVV